MCKSASIIGNGLPTRRRHFLNFVFCEISSTPLVITLPLYAAAHGAMAAKNAGGHDSSMLVSSFPAFNKQFAWRMLLVIGVQGSFHDTSVCLHHFNCSAVSRPRSLHCLESDTCLIADTRAPRTSRSSAPPRSAASASRWWRRWRPSAPGSRAAATSTRSTAAPCASTWSTSS